MVNIIFYFQFLLLLLIGLVCSQGGDSQFSGDFNAAAFKAVASVGGQAALTALSATKLGRRIPKTVIRGISGRADDILKPQTEEGNQINTVAGLTRFKHAGAMARLADVAIAATSSKEPLPESVPGGLRMTLANRAGVISGFGQASGPSVIQRPETPVQKFERASFSFDRPGTPSTTSKLASFQEPREPEIIPEHIKEVMRSSFRR